MIFSSLLTLIQGTTGLGSEIYDKYRTLFSYRTRNANRGLCYKYSTFGYLTLQPFGSKELNESLHARRTKLDIHKRNAEVLTTRQLDVGTEVFELRCKIAQHKLLIRTLRKKISNLETLRKQKHSKRRGNLASNLQAKFGNSFVKRLRV